MAEGERDGAIEVEGALVDDLVPGGVELVVKADDGVARGDADGGGGSAEGDVVDDGGALEILVDLMVEVGDEGEEDEGEDEVGEGTGEGDEGALPAGMGVELAGGFGTAGDVGGGEGVGVNVDAEDVEGLFCGLGVVGLTGGVAGFVAGHFDVAAEREEGDAVVRTAGAPSDDARAHADGEGFDGDTAELGDGEVAELVDEDHDAEDDGEFYDDERDVHADEWVTLRAFAVEGLPGEFARGVVGGEDLLDGLR